MKKILWIIASFFGVLGIVAIALFVVTEIRILDPEEQQKLKEGKSFWEWPSDYGPLNMHYIEKGQGSNHIIFLHGFRSHSYTWKDLIDPLADAGYHVWAIDLVGFGLSDKPEAANYNVDFFRDQVDAFMQAKGIAKMHMVGNSMGGGLALILALAHPHQIQSLVLLNALGYPLEMPLYLYLAKHASQFWAPFLGPTMVRLCLKQIVYHPDQVTDEQVEAYSLPYRFPGGITASISTLQRFDNQRLAEMCCQYASLSTSPILIIWGDHDNLIPVSHYEKFLKDFPHADKVLINQCGHIPQEENPQAVLAAILPFLEKASKRD